MVRGGIFVGVDRTTGGGLPTLNAAAAGAKQMHEWATAPDQGAIAPELAHLITDADGAVVTADSIIDAVRAVIDQGVEQLILYFSGHGMIVDHSETWLLSRAPQQGSAAISVFMSTLDARSGRTPHVVIISDACRTPARDLQGQRLTGVSAFPNDPLPVPNRRVDVFYACTTGQAALEVNTVAAQGIYTEVLHDALQGKVVSILTAAQAAGDSARYLYSGELGVYLEQAVADRLIDLNISQDQTPAFEVQFGTANLHWLARFQGQPPMAPPGLDFDVAGIGPALGGAILSPPHGLPDMGGVFFPDARIPAAEARTVTQIADALLRSVADDAQAFEEEVARAAEAPAPGARDFATHVAQIAEPFARARDPRTTVVRIRGATPTNVHCRDASVAVARRNRIIRSQPGDEKLSVVVEFDNDTVAALPIVPGFITDVLIRDREILSLALEPRAGGADTPVRQVRAVVAAGARHGRPGVATDGLQVATALAGAAPTDPVIAVYAAYAAQALGSKPSAAELAEDLDAAAASLFDVELLAGRLRDGGARRSVAPLLPLLSQGWPLLPTLGPGEDTTLGELRELLLPSLWTVFDAGATDLLVAAEVADQ
ncbi:caspase family protein [Mycobacterium sp. ACS4331]|uniref:caspase family protein n=1 Tax=Mycobacterium sp. ACS4331 TaxID=1834121 RepID=UPI000801305D|nr:caspase family protein [Mycobacterium sp. ACS4331]OBF20017.1 hypothetical protein A5727_09720 [Mycobacterium sp. ACS4331]